MARSTRDSQKPASAKAKPDLRLSIEIAGGVDRDGNPKDPELFRCGALWAHKEGDGFGGYFINTGDASKVRLALFAPRDGEYESERAPDLKVFVERAAVGQQSKGELIFAGLAWWNKDGTILNGHINGNLFQDRSLRFAAFPPKDAEE